MRVAFFERSFFGQDLGAHCGGLAATFVPFTEAEELLREAEVSDVLILPEPFYTSALVAKLRRAGSPVRLVQLTSAGAETIGRWGVPDGLRVASAVGVWSPAVAEHAVTMLLASVRRVAELERARQACKWVKGTLISRFDDVKPGDNIIPRLRTIEDAVVGIVGYGSLGSAVAARLKPFGSRIVGFARTPRPLEHADRSYGMEQFRTIVPELDALVCCLPSTPDTHHLIDAAIFALLKPNAVFVNIGRGVVVDEPSMIDWLRREPRSSAALDVFETEPLPPDHALWTLENVILSPHVSAIGGLCGVRRLMALCCDNLTRMTTGAPLRNIIHDNEQSSADRYV